MCCIYYWLSHKLRHRTVYIDLKYCIFFFFNFDLILLIFFNLLLFLFTVNLLLLFSVLFFSILCLFRSSAYLRHPFNGEIHFYRLHFEYLRILQVLALDLALEKHSLTGTWPSTSSTFQRNTIKLINHVVN